MRNHSGNHGNGTSRFRPAVPNFFAELGGRALTLTKQRLSAETISHDMAEILSCFRTAQPNIQKIVAAQPQLSRFGETLAELRLNLGSGRLFRLRPGGLSGWERMARKAPSKVNRSTKRSSLGNPSSKGLCGRRFRWRCRGWTRRCDGRF